MNWRTEPLRRVAPPQASTRHFGDSDEVWHLNLDQIEAQTGRILARKHAPAAEAGGSTFVFDEGNVLYSKLRPYLNKVVRPSGVGIATTELVPLRPVPGVLDADFLTYFLRSSEFVAFASACVAGVKMPRVIMDKLWQHPVPLPPPIEQRRIVELLDQADALRRQRAEADAKADRVLPALFFKMFGDPATNPKGWPTKPFAELLSEEPRNGVSPSSSGTVASRVLTLTAITGNAFDGSAWKLGLFASTPARDKIVDERDFLICRGNGNVALVGRGYFPTQSLPDTAFPDTIIAARLDRSRVHPRYIECVWALPGTRKLIEERARTTSGIHKVNQSSIGSVPLALPPLERQQAFGRMAECFRSKSTATARKQMELLFTVLLNRAFSGELTSSWREAHINELLQEMKRQARYLASLLPPEART